MYKWGGKEGGRLLFRIYSTPDFIPRNTPYGQPSVHTGKRLHPATETAGLPSGERLGIFRETVELPVWISGKGSMPVLDRRRTGIARESCSYPPVMCGKKRGAHVQADLLTAGFPLNARYSVIVPDSQRVTIDFSRFSGRGLFCPPAPRRA